MQTDLRLVLFLFACLHPSTTRANLHVAEGPMNGRSVGLIREHVSRRCWMELMLFTKPTGSYSPLLLGLLAPTDRVDYKELYPIGELP